MANYRSLSQEAQALLPEVTALRHRIHRRPEVGLQLPQTQQAILEALDGLGLEIITGVSTTSVTAVLRGGGDPANVVLLRADMDALPVTEQTGLVFASEIDGVMHACGHDMHTAMLVGAAKLLGAHREELTGDVVFMFQPGEEGWDGAGHMLEEGVLTASGVQVGAAYAMHVSSNRAPSGVFSSRPGQFQASSSKLVVKVLGQGGHGSAPHRAVDPIAAAAEMVTALETMITRRFDVFDPVVLTVGMIHGGTRNNIIPPEVEFQATIRTFSDESAQLVGRLSQEVCADIAHAHGATVETDWHIEYPSTYNDEEHVEFASGVIRELFGRDSYFELSHPGSGSEDFSRVLQRVPGCYVNLGASVSVDYENAAANHSTLAAFDDAVMPRGITVYAELARRALERLAAARAGDGAAADAETIPA